MGRGEAAVLTLAGGQGTRLGFAGPKGAFKIGLPSNASLFELFGHRIAAVERLAVKAAIEAGDPIPPNGPVVHWLVMTSPSNDEATRQFFTAADYFGRPRSSVKFFVQGTLPAVDFEGRLLLAGPGRLALSPDGA